MLLSCLHVHVCVQLKLPALKDADLGTQADSDTVGTSDADDGDSEFHTPMQAEATPTRFEHEDHDANTVDSSDLKAAEEVAEFEPEPEPEPISSSDDSTAVAPTPTPRRLSKVVKRFSEKFSKKVEAEEKLKKEIMSELSGVSLRKLFNMCDATDAITEEQIDGCLEDANALRTLLLEHDARVVEQRAAAK